MPSVPGHIMMNVWAVSENDPKAVRDFGSYTSDEAHTAYYKEFTYTPLKDLRA